MRWHSLQHAPFEGPGYLEKWARDRRFALTCTELWRGCQLPDVRLFEGLLVLGGPMNADEHSKYPWLATEKQFIAQAISAKKLVVGICLGAQLISIALGGSVTKNQHREIGWFPVQLTPEGRKSILWKRGCKEFMALHWHGDRLAIPPRAVRLARSNACEEQAFIHDGRVVGLQFHLEVTSSGLEALIENCPPDARGEPFVQGPADIQALARHIPRSNRMLAALLDGLCSSVGALALGPSGQQSIQSELSRSMELFVTNS